LGLPKFYESRADPAATAGTGYASFLGQINMVANMGHVLHLNCGAVFLNVCAFASGF
jgi:hypothetical protein